MSNLKGSSFEKQCKDIHHRLSSFGEGRHGNNDHQTHSSALSEKREEYSRSFADYAEREGLEGKLNELMTNENISSFLEERTADLSSSTSENYVRGFGSMIEGLKESNIDIEVDKKLFDDIASEIKVNSPTQEIETGRAIDNVGDKIADLYAERFESGVIADIQNELGLRVSEAHELASNLEKYHNQEDSTVQGIVGKGNHEYNTKDISEELVAKIGAMEEIPSLRTYQDDLQKHDISSHDFRYTFAEREFNERIADGMNYNQALKEVSEELNHNREDMTLYYLARV